MRKDCFLLLFALSTAGCRSNTQPVPQQPVQQSQQQCAPDDTPDVCKVVKQCFASGTSTEVCRMGEKDAMRSRKGVGPAYNGAADALKNGSSPTPKAAPKQ